jgi:hypothetical protein
MRAVVDNDILLKGSCYGLLKMLTSTATADDSVGILGASKFLVPKKIKKTPLRRDPAIAEAHFAAFLAENEVLEPSADEQHLAATLEAAAQQMGLNLDAGESQLVAILVSRQLGWLLTGDKRAVASIEILFEADARLSVVTGKIRCLEQLVWGALTIGNAEQMRDAICAEPSVDKTLSICFCCGSPEAHSDPLEGLSSYIADLRTRAGRVLAS